MNKILLILIIISVFLIGIFSLREPNISIQIDQLSKASEENIEEENVSEEQEVPKDEKLPMRVLYDVPFTAQAPFGNWDDVRQDTGCEEASIFMAMKWVYNEGLTLEEAEQEIIAMSEFEKENYGHHHDTSSKDTVKLIKDYYNYDKVYIEYDIGAEDIKTALAQGNLLIVPINGQMVGNPYYTLPGPFQHKIVIRGYDDETQEFITNDPGTKRGDSYKYNYQVLENALMDYPTGFNEPVEEIITSMIVVAK